MESENWALFERDGRKWVANEADTVMLWDESKRKWVQHRFSCKAGEIYWFWYSLHSSTGLSSKIYNLSQMVREASVFERLFATYIKRLKIEDYYKHHPKYANEVGYAMD